MSPSPWPLTSVSVDDLRSRLREHTLRGERDAAWCVASVLHHMGVADTAETALFERDAPRNPLPRRKVDRFTWRAGLAHPDEDARISAVFEPLVPALFACVSASYRALALRRRDLVDPMTSDLMLGRSWDYVLSCLEPAIRPNLYLVDARRLHAADAAGGRAADVRALAGVPRAARAAGGAPWRAEGRAHPAWVTRVGIDPRGRRRPRGIRARVGWARILC